MNLQATLTKRESEIARLLAWGASKKMIAHRLGISERTVENIARSIYVKADVHSVGELAAWYFCTHFNISVLYSPLLSLMFIVLMGVSEMRPNLTVMRPKRVAVRMVKREDQ